MKNKPFEDHSGGPERTGENPTPLDRWLDEAAAAERAAPAVDTERFMERLRLRIAPLTPNPFRERPAMARAFAVAAMIPLVLALWLCFGLDENPRPLEESISAEELALIDDLDLLEILDDLPSDEIVEIDPDLFDLYLRLEVLEELPVEVLGNS